MKIILAKAAGFCMGVRRAMHTVLDEARAGKRPIRTHGPLIHNPQVIEMLRGKGVEILDQAGAPDGQGTVIIRAHGVTPEEKERLCGCGYDVVDATCPHVIRIQKLIAGHVARGESVIIVGDRGHAEVEGLLGYAQGRGYVIENEGDVAALPDLGPICVVSQTTQSREHFANVLRAVQARWPEAIVHRTICGSTDRRQQETIEIARRSDAMIVVGGRNSANTVRLAQLAAETGTPTYHVETSDELDFSKLRGLKTIGLTAGASTPNWMIVEVMERIKESMRQGLHTPVRWSIFLLKILLDTNLYSALGAFCLGLACIAMHPLRVEALPLTAIFSAALYIFAMYSLALPAETQVIRYSDPLRWRFLQKWRRSLTILGGASIAGALTLTAFLGPWAFALMAVATAAGLIYRMTVLPVDLLPGVKHRRLVDIPGSKDLFMGLAWASVLALLPLLAPPMASGSLAEGGKPMHWIGAWVCFLYVFVLVFTRSVVYDLREIQADQIVGRETIPVVLGKRRTRTVLAVLTVFLLAAMAFGKVAGALTDASYFMLLPIIYTWGYLYLYHRRTMVHGMVFEAVVGGKFILAGVLAAAWLLVT
ncbi:4-hydroxy-3-methylbut-2-enyl diphosphate reductase [bacterium]|nr:4-hydroxy-3-methylbut-2-enyl diphosphate reductase [bacterium]